MSAHDVVSLTEEENDCVTRWSAVYMLAMWSLAALAVFAFAAGAMAAPENLWRIQVALGPYALVYGLGLAISYVARKRLLTKASQARTTENVNHERQQWQKLHKN